MEEDGIVFEQGVKTSEVKNDGDEVVVVTDKGAVSYTHLDVYKRQDIYCN